MNSSRLVTWVAPSSISILPKSLMLEQHQVLVLGLPLVEHLLDRVAHAEAELVEQRFGNPALGFAMMILPLESLPVRPAIPSGAHQDQRVTAKPGNGQMMTSSSDGYERSVAAPWPRSSVAHRDPLDLEGLAQDRHASVRIGLAAHEDVERGVAVSGQVWIEMWLSASTATPDTPPFGSK